MGEKQRDEMEFVVVDETGNTVYRGRITGKGYRKSLESGELWASHPETGRLLPLGDGIEFLSLDEREGVVEAIVSDADGARLETRAVDPHDSHGAEEGRPAAAGDTDPGHVSESSSGSSASRRGRESAAEGDRRGPELSELDRTVAARRASGGDGSYTAYLFEQGETKIRKKLGEEAIELCLAEDDRELISESADLLYHLSVLLAARGLSYEEVMEELRRRRDE